MYDVVRHFLVRLCAARAHPERGGAGHVGEQHEAVRDVAGSGYQQGDGVSIRTGQRRWGMMGRPIFCCVLRYFL